MAKRTRTKEEWNHDEAEVESVPWESAEEVQVRPLEWLVPSRIVRAAICILEGEKGVSKSTLSVALAAAVTTGKPLWGRKKLPKGDVLWLPGEEDVALHIRPRLMVAGADLARVHFPPRDRHGIRQRLCLPADTDTLVEQILRFDCKLVVIDPLGSFVPPGCDLRVDQVIHDVLDPVADIAAAYDCTVLVNRNLTKGRSASRVDRGQGGVAVGGIARSILCIDWPDESLPRRVLRVVRCNLVPNTLPVEFRLEDVGGFGKATGFREMTPEEVNAEDDEEDVAERDVLADACKMLKDLLSKGPVSSKVVIAEAASIQISPRTLRRAKVKLCITSKRVIRKKEARWDWVPPKEWLKE